jgi:HEAT repeat protein
MIRINEVTVLVVATITILIILLLILLYLITRKTIENRESVKVKNIKKEMETPLFESISQGKGYDLAYKNRYSIKAMEELLKHYSDTVGGTLETYSLTAIAEKYLLEGYRNALRSRSWSKRINALYHIEDFKMYQLSDEVRQLLQSRLITREEVIISIRFLAAAAQLKEVFEFVNKKYTNLTDFDYRSILFKLDEQSFRIFVERFSECHSTLQWSILEIISIRKDLSYLSFVERVFQNHKGETRIRALKAIASIGFTTDIEQFFSLSESSEWQERMLIAKLIGFFPSDSSYNILEDLIHDQNWWVRSQAAESFTKLPKGRELLKKLMESSHDPYARDIASEWLDKGEI